MRVTSVVSKGINFPKRQIKMILHRLFKLSSKLCKETKLAARTMTHIVRSRKLKLYILCFEQIINLHIFVQNQNNNLLHTTLRKVANIAWDCTFVSKKAVNFLLLRTISFWREYIRYRSNKTIATYNIEIDWNINN